MSTATVRSGSDTWAASAKPSTNYARGGYVQVKSGAAFAYIFFKSPVPRGATVISATLRVRAASTAAGTVTMTGRRIATSWKVGRLTWNNKPGVTGVAKTDAIAGVAVGDRFELDVTQHLQSIADGAPNYGWRLEVNSATQIKLNSLNAPSTSYRPVLEVEWADRPDAPTTLIPSSGAVSVAKPVLRFDYSDPAGNDPLAAVQVQIDAAGDFSTPDFDSGQVDATEPQLDLSATAYAGLADGSSTYWRVRVKDGSGLWSLWSDAATFSRDGKGTVTITAPAAAPDDVVTDFTPPIAWSFTGETQVSWQLRIARAVAPSTYLHDSGRRTSTATEYTLPAGVLKDDQDYVVTVRVWDAKGRVTTPGDPAYSVASRTFRMDYDGTVAPVTSLTAAQIADSPGVRLTFVRSELPDEWALIRDGKLVEKVTTASDLLESGTTYVYDDFAARPGVSHTWAVRPVENGVMGSGGPTATVTAYPDGIWVCDPDKGLYARLGGTDVTDVTAGEDAAVHIAVGASRVVRIVAGLRGLEGSMKGPIRSSDFAGWDDYEAALEAMRLRPTDTFRLVWGNRNIPVLLGNVTVVPHPDTLPNEPTLQGSFSFWQNGEQPEAEL